MSFQNLKRFFNYDNQEVFQIEAQSVLPKCVHFRIIELAKFSAVDNTCDVTWLTTKRNYRVLKCDVIKNQNCEIMRFVGTFWKNSIQEAYLPKTSIVAQIVPEMLAQLCPLTRTQFVSLQSSSYRCSTDGRKYELSDRYVARGLLPVVAYAGRIRKEGVRLSGVRYRKGYRDFTIWGMWNNRKVYHDWSILRGF